jgi:hypothetical protein
MLLSVSRALNRLEGQWQQEPPSVEDLHVAWLEDGVTAAQVVLGVWEWLQRRRGGKRWQLAMHS